MTKKILIVTLSNIGDVIMTTPVMMALVGKFPNAELTVVAGPRARGLLESSRFIRRLVTYDKHENLAWKWNFLRELRSVSYDLVIDLRNSAIPYLVRTKKRSPPYRLFKSANMRERHLELLKMTGLDQDGLIPVFDFYHPPDEEKVFQKLNARGISGQGGWILVAPAAQSELKTWRLEGFREVLLSLLHEHPEKNILLVGDQRERAIADPLTSIDPARVHNLCGETTLPELAVLVSRCALILANDSALMHLGYELKRPVAAVFGPTSFTKYGHPGPRFKIIREPVFCSPCEQPVCRFERQACFEDLKSEKVFQACRELLSQGPESGCGDSEPVSNSEFLTRRAEI